MGSLDLRRYYRTQKRGKVTVTYVSWADLCHAVNEARWVWSWDVDVVYSGGAVPAIKGTLTVRSSDGEVYVSRCALAPVNFDEVGGNPWEEAESAAFRRAWAKFGVGLELWRGGKDGNME